MKRTILLSLLLLMVFSCFSQEIPLFPVDKLLLGKEKPFNPSGCKVKQIKAFPDSLIEACIHDINKDSITYYLQTLEDFGTRFMLADNHRDVAEWIKNKFYALGYTNAVLDSFECITQWPANTGPYDTSWQYNVFASLEGHNNPDLEVMVGGHYDAIIYSGGDPFLTAPGADDNGSAIAATLELARVLKMKNIQPSSTIVFAAWAGEERGLHGSVNKVIKALTNGEQIKTYINMDMVANEPDTTNWGFKINIYEGSEWLVDVAHDIALSHTALTPNAGIVNSQGSDSYVFYLGGFPTVYFTEDHFSLNYHHITDLVVNCNMPYCAEITKVAMGTLLTADLIPSRVRYELFNPGTGNSLIAQWIPNPETNLAGYKIQVGYASGNYFQTFMTTNNSYTLDNLSPDTVYYVAVSAVNNDGYAGPATEYFDRPALVTLDQGILIVDDSEGGILNPPDSLVDSFYDSLLQNFQHTEYDAYIQEQISLGDLGKYSSILWHINRQTTVTVLNRYLKEVINYLKLGGHIFFTIYQPEKAIYKISSYPTDFPPGTFIYDYLRVKRIELNAISRFNAAMSQYSVLPNLYTDSSKTQVNLNYHMTHIEAVFPVDTNYILYRYGTSFDTATLQGDMYGLPVGIRGYRPWDPWKTILLSFPLYYMEYSSAKALTEYIMQTYFGELPLGIHQESNQPPSLSIIPNPANNQAVFEFTLERPERVKFSVYNLMGDLVRVMKEQNYTTGTHHATFSLTGLATGLYFVKMQAGDSSVSKKLMIANP